MQQFQAGIKRHRFNMRTRIGVDRATGKIQAFAADHILDGGGLANLSAQVATVGATAAIGIYDIPKVDITTVALHTRGVTAGSMRGYGTLQTMTALEVLIDELAHALPLDPIELRRRNALKPGGRTMTGNPYSASVRTAEILDKLAKHPIWQQRGEEQARARQAGKLAGTGVACATKDYGTGADCSLGRVEIDPDGHIAIYCDHVEMGTGIGTALANRVAAQLGSVADEVSVARVDTFGALALVTSGDPYTMTQAAQDAAQRNPRLGPGHQHSHHRLHRCARWHPCRGSRGARHFPVRTMACGARPLAHRAVGRQGETMGRGAMEGRAAARARPGATRAAGHRAKGARAQFRDRRNGARFLALGLVARRRFAIDGQPWTADIDALAVRRGVGNFSAA